MEKTIIINGSPFTFDNEIITYENSTAITEKDAIEIVTRTKELFDSIGLKFYLAFGTLLGTVRDNGIIPGDEDVDVFITDEGLLYNNIPNLYQKGFRIVRYSPGKVYSFRINEKCYIDVYILRRFRNSIWGLYCYSLCNKAMPKKYFKSYESIDFLGVQCECPANPEKLLEFWYGKEWRTPVRGHEFRYEVRSRYYWRHNIRPFLKKLIVKRV